MARHTELDAGLREMGLAADQIDPEGNLEPEKVRRTQEIRLKARRRKAREAPTSIGGFGSTMNQIDMQARESMRRSAFEPDEDRAEKIDDLLELLERS
jgi:hypothetical protein